jgi:hypothetical protein
MSFFRPEMRSERLRKLGRPLLSLKRFSEASLTRSDRGTADEAASRLLGAGSNRGLG